MGLATPSKVEETQSSSAKSGSNSFVLYYLLGLPLKSFFAEKERKVTGLSDPVAWCHADPRTVEQVSSECAVAAA